MSSSRPDTPRGMQALLPMSEERARGVPREQQFEIRRNAVAVDTESILLHRIVFPDGVQAAEFGRMHGLEVEGSEVWQVGIVYTDAARLLMAASESNQGPDAATANPPGR